MCTVMFQSNDAMEQPFVAVQQSGASVREAHFNSSPLLSSRRVSLKNFNRARSQIASVQSKSRACSTWTAVIMTKLVHLVYIHGFQGNDTTFQSFPNDLQVALSARIPQHLDIKIQSSLYPTYKSVKPISYATKNFLEWLSTQPPGPVILMGHSMGGLLAADAATDISNNPDRYPGAKPRRIIGMVAFDTPYLGMHPHVVISGIASLFQDDDKDKRTESEMNPHPNVNIVDGEVTDDWEKFKKGLNERPKGTSFTSESQSFHSCTSRTPSPLPPTVLSPNAADPPSPGPLASPQAPSPLVDRALAFLSSHSEDPLVRWVRKHADDPLGAGKRWVIEHFQFGSCMFDPPGLKERYIRLVNWQGGVWVNYWTQTVPRPAGGGHDKENEKKKEQEQDVENDVALLENGIAETPKDPTLSNTGHSPSSPPTSPSLNDPDALLTVPTKSEMKDIKASQKEDEKRRKQVEKEKEKELKKLRKRRDAEAKSEAKSEKEKNKAKPGRHFIVLPTGLGAVLGGGEKWEKVLIGGVEDEVAAHCGLFIRGQNLDYDGLVERVGTRIVEWCQKL